MVRLKYILIMLWVIVFSSMCLAAETENKPPVVPEEEKTKEKIEVGFLFGPGIPFGTSIPQFSFRNSVSYSHEWYWYDYSYFDTEYFSISYAIRGRFSSSIAGDSERGIGFGGFFNYFFHRNFGYQFMLERSTHNVPVEASHGVDILLLYPYWSNGVEIYWGDKIDYSAEPSIDDTRGNLIVIPISFNAIARFDPTENVSGYVSGGITYYKMNIEAESKAGFGLTYNWYDDEQDLNWLVYDSVLIPVSIDDAVSGFGGNVGGGVVFKIQENVGIVADFRYYLGPKKYISWTPKSGTYQLILNDEYDLPPPHTIALTQTYISSFLEQHGEFFKVEVNPSFFRLAFGLLIRF